MSSRSTSPDPILEPSPAPVGHQARQQSAKPPATRPKRLSQSPSKSFYMDTGRSGDVSPWRIRVTVSAEPTEEASPSSKRSRTTKVPLKGLSSSPRRRGSPKKQFAQGQAADDEEHSTGRPQKRRKGTPIARHVEAQREGFDPVMEEDESLSQQSQVLSSPAKRALSARSERRSAQIPTERTQRLLHARRELDHAIEDAVGSSDPTQDNKSDFEAGDMTVANEDFTMVSVETLETMKNNTSLLDDSKTGHADKSGVNVSYFPSSPPQARMDDHLGSAQVQYPDLSAQAPTIENASAEDAGYDAMSWKPTGPAKLVSSAPQDHNLQTQRYDEPSEWQREREIVSKQIDNASASQVIVINDETELASHNLTDGDIWAEEASREEESLTGSQIAASRRTRTTTATVQAPAAPKSTAEQLNDLFSAQPAKPPRSKIPRTWRRSSGMEFSYVDSPAAGSFVERDSPPGSTDEDRKSGGSRHSGVLTPPGTDDEVSKNQQQEEEGDSSLTAAEEAQKKEMEQMIEDKELPQGVEEESLDEDGESSDSGSPCSMDGDDTGLFWQNNLPNVYRKQRPRPERQNAMDLSDLFAADKSSSPIKANPSRTKTESSAARPPTRGSEYRKAVLEPRDTNTSIGAAGRAPSGGDTSKQKVVNSPLRKSLLKSSKIGGGLVTSTPMQLHAPFPRKFTTRAQDDFSCLVEESESPAQGHHAGELSTIGENDRQGARGDGKTLSASNQDPRDEESMREPSWQDDASRQDGADDTLQSYEEHLNLDSPQKIRVNFNDSIGSSAVLTPKRNYGPLFGTNTGSTSSQHGEQSVSSAKEENQHISSSISSEQPGLLSRLTTTFWAAVIRPSGPTSIMPPTTSSDPDSASERFPAQLRARVRSRYGVLPSTHPWTFAHMWTMHRMVNSSLNNKTDSLIPKSGDLPTYLEETIGNYLLRIHSETEEFCFTHEHAHVVHTFMQTLVPLTMVSAMEKGEIEFLGDGEAKISRGQYADRHGNDTAFKSRPGKYIDPAKGSPITMDFVARTVGNVLVANQRNEEFAAKKEKMERRQRRHEARVRQLEEVKLREEIEDAAFEYYDDGDDNEIEERRAVGFDLDEDSLHNDD